MHGETLKFESLLRYFKYSCALYSQTNSAALHFERGSLHIATAIIRT